MNGIAEIGSIALLVLTILLIHGYHPFAEDAGVYIAGVLKLFDPRLYQHDASFVLANTHLSLFAHIGAFVLRTTHISLEWLLLIAHLASVFLFLVACRALARRVFPSPAARWSPILLAAAFFTLPVAGTTVMLMDPYVTARSFSMPLCIFALAEAIDRRWTRAGVFLITAAIMHPLITIYVGAFITLFVLVDQGRMRVALTLAAFSILVCAVVYAATIHAPVDPAWRKAVLSRRSLFISEWRWYECLGLALPLLFYAVAFRRLGAHILIGKLCFVALILGTSAALAALLFVHPSNLNFFLTRLQLLRAFHMVYLVGIILLGGFIGQALWTRRRLAVCAIFAAAALAMFVTDRLTYPASDHIELPGYAPRNPWEQAFLWIHANAPRDAVFAADPDLVLLTGEDGQSFRLISGRSLLADFKDEGIALVFPEVAPQWAAEYNAQRGIDQLSDIERVARLGTLGATWVLLSRDNNTSLPCAYRNAAAQVCPLVIAKK
ncbi:MAG: hypothetical protein JOZ83_06955 [Silvibacterium sp.]|nr:hypothetical protein [Silvibacterium sp.]